MIFMQILVGGTNNYTSTPTFASGTQFALLLMIESWFRELVFANISLILILASFLFLFQQKQVLGAGTPALVQSNYNVGYSVTSLTTTFSSNVTANDLIVVGFQAGAAVNGITAACVAGNLTIADSLYDGSAYYYDVAYGIVSSGGPCSVTANLAASGNIILAIHEVSDIATTNPLDVTSEKFSNYGSTITPSSGAATTTASGDYVFGWI